ncbi:uncharacterized protein KY384_003926 [Bacidia gigantensis]|uniref:uncharacterized protein n=1 Tax=Bacidia gigantensis TaxID=2732470 RepID=UPI001D040CCE|nr:uncharacterized protein KY384_003926 [Bacidia gigantensis]KAG8532285.1 hypothetical protein KY384_003926 [Bacidia gigantensis]
MRKAQKAKTYTYPLGLKSNQRSSDKQITTVRVIDLALGAEEKKMLLSSIFLSAPAPAKSRKSLERCSHSLRLKAGRYSQDLQQNLEDQEFLTSSVKSPTPEEGKPKRKRRKAAKGVAILDTSNSDKPQKHHQDQDNAPDTVASPALEDNKGKKNGERRDFRAG